MMKKNTEILSCKKTTCKFKSEPHRFRTLFPTIAKCPKCSTAFNHEFSEVSNLLKNDHN